jgi:hypothetical protein
MIKVPLPTNIDDAFTDGWMFGRGFNRYWHPEINSPGSKFPKAIMREYERGVYEGHAFQMHLDRGQQSSDL